MTNQEVPMFGYDKNNKVLVMNQAGREAMSRYLLWRERFMAQLSEELDVLHPQSIWQNEARVDDRSFE